MSLVHYNYQNNYENSNVHNNNNNYEIALKHIDLFIEFSEYLNKEYGLNTLSAFFENSKIFKLKLDEILTDYYLELELKNYKEAMNLLKILIYLVDCYKMSFMKLTNFYFMEKINSYFKSKKSKTNDVDPSQSNNKFISNLQLEWAMRIHNMETYYKIVIEKNRNKIDKRENYSVFSRAISYISDSFTKSFESIEYKPENNTLMN